MRRETRLLSWLGYKHIIVYHGVFRLNRLLARQMVNTLFSMNSLYTQATSKYRIQLELETPLGEALVEDKSYSIVKTNNDG